MRTILRILPYFELVALADMRQATVFQLAWEGNKSVIRLRL